jgi:hypothetical protein
LSISSALRCTPTSIDTRRGLNWAGFLILRPISVGCGVCIIDGGVGHRGHRRNQ